MKSSNILAAITLSIFAIAGAHAETYDGVHPLTSSASRADVAREAAVVAHAGNTYGEGAGAQAFTSTADRAAVRAQAVAKARENRDSLDPRSFYRDQVPAQFDSGVSFTRQAAR